LAEARGARRNPPRATRWAAPTSDGAFRVNPSRRVVEHTSERPTGSADINGTQRPHEALDLDPPAAHYQPSPRPFPDTLPELRFPPGAAIRRTDDQGRISWHGRTLRVGRPFQRQTVGILPDDTRDGVILVYFNALLVRSIDLTGGRIA